MRITLLAIPVASALCHAVPAFAQQAWEYDLTLYSWLTSLSGDVSTVPGLPPANIDYSFGDILDDLEGSAMIYGQARNGPWSILVDATYVHTASNADIGGPVINSVNVDTKMTTLGLDCRVLSRRPMAVCQQSPKTGEKRETVVLSNPCRHSPPDALGPVRHGGKRSDTGHHRQFSARGV